MPVAQFTDQQLSNWAQSYEKELCAKHDLIVDRISLGVTAFNNEYEIPNYVTNIRSVLWQGRELYAKGFRASVIVGDTPFQTAGSVPYEYVFSGKGMRVLKFYPSPNLDVPFDAGDLWNPTADRNDVIVEFYRTPGLTPELQLPEWCRRYLLKDYVCLKAFKNEGPQQDLRAAAYYEGRIAAAAGYVNQLSTNMQESAVSVLFQQQFVGRRKPGKPVLPPNFGYRVNW